MAPGILHQDEEVTTKTSSSFRGFPFESKKSTSSDRASFPSVLGLGTANPEKIVTQAQYAESYIPFFTKSEKWIKFARTLAKLSGINQRHVEVTNEMYTKIPKLLEVNCPSLTERLQLYKDACIKLSCEAVERAILDWGGSKSDITHLITFTNSGQLSPGLDFSIIESLELNPEAHHFYVSYVGCHGGLVGLRMASDIAKADSRNRVLIVAAEVNSSHVKAADPENPAINLISNVLFGDGAAAYIVGTEPRQNESPLFEVHDSVSRLLEGSEGSISAMISSQGVDMEYKENGPKFIKAEVDSMVRELLGQKLQYNDVLWAVHPGGKPMLDAVENGCKISPEKMNFSRKILRNYGNMASATTLFVLDEIRKNESGGSEGKWTVALAFGPGISAEGVLLKLVT